MTLTAPRTILILEDEALLSAELKVLLEDHGYGETIFCHSVEAAMQHIKSATPDLALLDLNLGPGRSSVLVAMRLKSLGCPFAFVTAFTDNSVLSSKEFGDVPAFTKPIDPGGLLPWIDGQLSSARPAARDDGERPIYSS